MAEQFGLTRAQGNLTVGQIEADLLEYIENWSALPPRKDYCRNRGIPTFRNLQPRYGRQGVGQLTMYFTDHANVILWRNLSQSLTQAITNLLVEGKIHWHVAFLTCYEDEGGPLPLPLAEWPITEEYNTGHWLPVYFKPGPSCDNDRGCPNYTGTEEQEEEPFETT
jgi:hypothetical protein